MFKRMRIKGKLLVLIITYLFVFGIIVNMVIFNQFNGYVTENTLEKDANLSLELINARFEGYWKVVDGQLYKGEVLIHENYDLVDCIKEAANVECTIFLNDTRVTTTIVDNGKRAIQTTADPNVVNKVIKEGKEYLGATTILGEMYKTIYTPIRDESGTTIGMFFVGITEATIYDQVSPIMLEIILITLVIILLIIITIPSFTNRIIARPMKALVENLKKMEQGDLSFEMSEKLLHAGDEFGDISRALSKTRDGFKRMIQSIKEQSLNITTNSEGLRAVSQEMSSASSNVTMAVQDIAKGTTQQSLDLEDITAVTAQFSERLEHIVHAFDVINESTNTMDVMANESAVNMGNLSSSMNEMELVFTNNEHTMKLLGEKINKINEILNVINGIANQTNLLALNAAIEAARAGEAGKGFGVVADEIRKLAEESRKSSENITILIKDIVENNENMTKSSVGMREELTKETDIVKIAVDSFTNIIDALHGMVPKMEEIKEASISIQEEKNKLVGKIEGASAVSEEISASSEEISASSEEMHASIEEVAATAQSFHQITNKMLDQVNQFKL